MAAIEPNQEFLEEVADRGKVKLEFGSTSFVIEVERE